MSMIIAKLASYNGFAIEVDDEGIFHASTYQGIVASKPSLGALKKEIRDTYAPPTVELEGLRVHGFTEITKVTVIGLSRSGRSVLKEGGETWANIYHFDQYVFDGLTAISRQQDELFTRAMEIKSSLRQMLPADIEKALAQTPPTRKSEGGAR